MNSQERREVRYQRRKAKRLEKKKAFVDSLGTYESIFSFENLYNAFYECRKGVRWKASIQNYEAKLLSNTDRLYEELQAGTWKSRGFTEFNLSERGKLRHIKSVHISERCIQKVFCDEYLVPLLSRSIIYDNGASMKYKGIDFALRRLKLHLKNHYKKYGTQGYVLLYDFSNYFGNINHNKLYDLVDKEITDDRLRGLYHQLIDSFVDGGVGLGSQVSQISAIYFANKLDHTFKDQLGVKGYARYMDDGYIISNSLDNIRHYKKILFDMCNELDITINERKVRICKIFNGFNFLKKRFVLKRNGNLLIKLSKSSFISVKHRLKKMYEKKLSYRTVYTSYMSWRGNAKKYHNFNKFVGSIDNLYNKLWIEPFIREGVYYE